MAEWTSQAFASTEETANQSHQCLECHFTDQSPSNVLTPHGWGESAERTLSKVEANLLLPSSGTLSSTQAAISLTELLGVARTTEQKTLQCAACHSEHRGKGHALSAISDSQCQGCHEYRFASFSDGHMEFGSKTTSTVIAFDHAKHRDRFEQTFLSCTDCHVEDGQRRAFLVKPFEDSCSGCHEQGEQDHHGGQIKKDVLNVIVLPELELEERNYWPTENAYGEELTPLMMFLLLGDSDPNTISLLAEIQDEAFGDLFEWRLLLEDNEEQYKQDELAYAIKRLAQELSERSTAASEARLNRISKATGLPYDDSLVQALAAELDAAGFVMLTFVKRLFPNIEEQADMEWATSRLTTGWQFDSESGSISYRPIAHGDRFVKLLAEAHLELKQRTDPDPMRSLIAESISNSFGEMTKPCTKCHTLSETTTWTFTANSSEKSKLFDFSHGPHLTVAAGGLECSSCHVIDQAKAEQNVHGFLSQEKESCSSCHNEKGASQDCVVCHKYHSEAVAVTGLRATAL